MYDKGAFEKASEYLASSYRIADNVFSEEKAFLEGAGGSVVSDKGVGAFRRTVGKLKKSTMRTWSFPRTIPNPDLFPRVGDLRSQSVFLESRQETSRLHSHSKPRTLHHFLNSAEHKRPTRIVRVVILAQQHWLEPSID